MIFLRWALFLPLAAILVSGVQLVTGTLAEATVWWVSTPIVLFFGVFILFASYIPCGTVCPVPLVGSTIFLTLFVLLEGLAIIGAVNSMSWSMLLIRLYIDILIVFGAVGAARKDIENAAAIDM